MSQTKTNLGNFFEDFSVGQVLQHATPRTLTVGDVALYMGLYGSRFAVQSSERVRQGDRLPARRSTTSSSSTPCSARPCRTSRSTPSPTWATPSAGSWRRSIRATR